MMNIFLFPKSKTLTLHWWWRGGDSVLKFTYELSSNTKIPFLDVLVKCNNTFTILRYKKPISKNYCYFNYNDKRLLKYKLMLEKIARAHVVSSSVT